MTNSVDNKNSAEPILSVRGLKVAFGPEHDPKEVLHGVSFDILPGEKRACFGFHIVICE